MTRTATLAGAISMLTNFGFYFGGGRNNARASGRSVTSFSSSWGRSPRALCKIKISRGREYEADRIGAEISKRPLSLASALRKI